MSDFTISTLVVGPLLTNCYLLINEETRRVVIIDAGGDGEYIKRVILSKGIKPEKLIATHGHFDHINASLDIKTSFNIEFFMNKKDEFLLDRAISSTEYFTGQTCDPPAKLDKYLTGGQRIDMAGFRFVALSTPGHTPGSITLYSKKLEVAFVGDLLFSMGGVGRTDFGYADYGQLKASIEEVFELPGKTRVYPGHGESFDLSMAKRYTHLL
jgi:hydroxyacylglutathione hydrolase